MHENTVVKLTRDVHVVKIPSGDDVLLPAGTEVVITQSLGGSYTLLVHSLAGLYRLASEQADALGRSAQTSTDDSVSTSNGDLATSVWNTLKTCYDPEIPVNIVDLGLVYEVEISDQNVSVKMTLTAPGCGMGPVIAADAQKKIAALPGVRNAEVSVVWDPPWSPERITQAGREKLGMA